MTDTQTDAGGGAQPKLTDAEFKRRLRVAEERDADRRRFLAHAQELYEAAVAAEHRMTEDGYEEHHYALRKLRVVIAKVEGREMPTMTRR